MSIRGLNEVSLIGNLGQDPEFKDLGDGKRMAVINVATNERWTDKETGEQKEVTDWHRVPLFGRYVDIAEKFLMKGTQVFLRGKLRTRKYQDNDGTERFSTGIDLGGLDGKLQILNGGRRPEPENGGQG
ncbi:TPA: single-stranded DNA-binding protein [Klebsiella pneumoniae]|uniref:single-stranded DNA-binding protein n=1 Tax=Klebsiella pneumoniae TaxID=573 RepID=UPI0023B00C06|nr:single-stranded DNA-binding protein [Klebsiella pneumoniae]MDE8392897.1 single-stranded DNA-binding protein [Klebsiella pneumoniae]HBU8764010.1 single-stranded DNA-binding protein [Klebsiella pneumoniae]